ncbi:uncharacterized protein LOC127833664 [Dreissena polymorpha]|uniref:DUF7886 domain-containing protein n=1 Tax=Dreissena polymorpha TaxID=45954 RepID=A0A9D4G486_DREPO|nr:uncharacterized protein LOC127833664 [Dreissena polymorpha]KAH3807257.1 hypothetical protein DPMN_135592 [Dreissena polymorpha]
MDPNETLMKKKLQSFLCEMLKFGTVKGFKHFAMYMRGREEMVLSVVNTPQMLSSATPIAPESLPVDKRKLSKSESFSSMNLPYDQRSLMLSIRSQMILSTHGVKDVGLPPASPSEEESLVTDDRSTLFLIAGYGRYSCPYVWVRSNHERLVKLTGSSREKDCPLKLKSTLKWKDQDIFVWDIVAELVKLCTYPSPRNPFEIDFDYFKLLPLSEKVLATVAMMNVLQKILVYTPDHKIYAGQVFEELQLITKQHFTALESLVKDNGLPAVLQQQQQHQQQQRQQHHSGPTSAPVGPGRTRTTSYNQPNSAPSYNQPYSAPSYNQPNSTPSYNQPNSTHSFNQPTSAPPTQSYGYTHTTRAMF